MRRDHGHTKNARAWKLSSDVNLTILFYFNSACPPFPKFPCKPQCDVQDTYSTATSSLDNIIDINKTPKQRDFFEFFFVAHLEIESSTLAVMATRRLAAREDEGEI